MKKSLFLRKLVSKLKLSSNKSVIAVSLKESNKLKLQRNILNFKKYK